MVQRRCLEIHSLYRCAARFHKVWTDSRFRTRAILSDEPWGKDHSVLREPWQEEEYLEGREIHRTLRFTVMHHVGVVLTDPPIQRFLAEMGEKSKNVGHQVIELAPFDGDEFDRILMQVLDATGSKDV